MITPKQKEIFRFIRHYLFRHEYGPTHEEIRIKFNFRSRGVVNRHIQRLAEEGLITKQDRKRRSIRLAKNISYNNLPIVGRIAAGNPIEPLESEQVLDLADLMLGLNRYVLQVKGNSMSGDNICDGDYIICEKRNHADSGEIAVVQINGVEATLKRLQYNKDGTITLLPSNPKLKPMMYDTKQIEVQGVYLGLIRLMESA